MLFKGRGGVGVKTSIKSFKTKVRFQTGPCVHLNRLSKSFYLTLRPKFIHRWPGDSSIISFFHKMKTKLDNLVCNAHMTFLDTPAVKGCSDLVFKTTGIHIR